MLLAQIVFGASRITAASIILIACYALASMSMAPEGHYGIGKFALV
jgi:hypothetical protein